MILIRFFFVVSDNKSKNNEIIRTKISLKKVGDNSEKMVLHVVSWYSALLKLKMKKLLIQIEINKRTDKVVQYMGEKILFIFINSSDKIKIDFFIVKFT